ncbi:MAG: PEGA domain-containing protein [Bryobacterales bacterium]|nr:PEGA domain-containing protein [Bryobacteraceae bacterium]MDW8130998.1 PEGA domain-containing protein [Bryobacterales bacterium]
MIIGQQRWSGCALALLAAALAPSVLEAQQGYIKTHVTPGRAGVFIDGKYVGPAANFARARTYAVEPGEREIRLVEPRYEEVTLKVTVPPGQTVRIRQTLKRLPPPDPPFGRLRILSKDKFAAVYVNGRFMGHADEFSNALQGLLLKPGEYTVKVAPLAGPEHEEKVRIQAGSVVVVRGN